MPAGQFKQVFEDHSRAYLMKKHEESQKLLEQRNEELRKLKEHYNDYKFKPKPVTKMEDLLE